MGTGLFRSVILLDVVPVLIAYRAEISVLVNGKNNISPQKVFQACRADFGRPHLYASRHAFQVLYGQCHVDRFIPGVFYAAHDVNSPYNGLPAGKPVHPVKKISAVRSRDIDAAIPKLSS